MFETNILNFTRRVEIARHGFESVTLKLAEDYDQLKAICAKHGIEISATRVRKVVKKFDEEREKTAAWRRILEQTTGALLRQSRPGATPSLTQRVLERAQQALRGRGVAHGGADVVVLAERAAGGDDHALLAQRVRPARHRSGRRLGSRGSWPGCRSRPRPARAAGP